MQKVVYVSSIAALDRSKVPMNEGTWGFEFPNPYYQAKNDAEKLAWEVAGKLNLWLVTVLPSEMVGPNTYGHLTPTIGFLNMVDKNRLLIDPNFASLFVYNDPAEHPRIFNEETDSVTEDQNGDTRALLKSAGGFGFLKASTFWYNVSVASLVNAISWGIMGWMPAYFMTTLGYSFARTGLVVALPYLVGAVAILLSTPFNKTPPVRILGINLTILRRRKFNEKGDFGHSDISSFCQTRTKPAERNTISCDAKPGFAP